MDYIEYIFGVSPDGGSGSLEFLFLAIPLCGLIYLALKRRSKTQPSRER